MSMKLRHLRTDVYGIYDDEDAMDIQGEVVHCKVGGWVLSGMDAGYSFKPLELVDIADLLNTLNRILPSG